MGLSFERVELPVKERGGAGNVSGSVGYRPDCVGDLTGQEEGEDSVICGGKGIDVVSDLCIGHAGAGVAPARGIGCGAGKALCLSAALCALSEGFESLQNQPMVR